MKNLAIANPFAGLRIDSFASTPIVDPNNTTLGMAISKLLPFVFSAAALIMLVYFVLAGLQLMTSRGDPKAVQMAQGKITTSLIGMAVIFLAFALVKLIGQMLGVGVFQTIFQ
jgi:hypothetical protein